MFAVVCRGAMGAEICAVHCEQTLQAEQGFEHVHSSWARRRGGRGVLK